MSFPAFARLRASVAALEDPAVCCQLPGVSAGPALCFPVPDAALDERHLLRVIVADTFRIQKELTELLIVGLFVLPVLIVLLPGDVGVPDYVALLQILPQNPEFQVLRRVGRVIRAEDRIFFALRIRRRSVPFACLVRQVPLKCPRSSLPPSFPPPFSPQPQAPSPFRQDPED